MNNWLWGLLAGIGAGAYVLLLMCLVLYGLIRAGGQTWKEFWK